METSEKRYVVLLTQEGKQAINSELALTFFLTDERYYTCISVDPNGPYLHMQIEKELIPGQVHKVELDIPHSYALAILSYDKRIGLGFAEIESVAERQNEENH